MIPARVVFFCIFAGLGWDCTWFSIDFTSSSSEFFKSNVVRLASTAFWSCNFTTIFVSFSNVVVDVSQLLSLIISSLGSSLGSLGS